MRMQHVIDADVQMKPVSSENRLPSNDGDAGDRMQLEESLNRIRRKVAYMRPLK